MTSETLKNPSVVTIPSPEGLDLALQTIQASMGTGLPWLEKVFGRARTMPTQVEGQTRQEPKVYQGSSEYYPVLPNDALRAYSFFRSMGPRKAPEPSQNVSSIIMSTPVDLIVWGNLQKVDPAKDWIFTEELIGDTMNLLNNSPGVLVGNVWDDKAEDVYKGYTIFPNHRDLLMYPFFAFRIEFALTFYVECQ